MKMNRLIAIGLVLCLGLAALSGCGNENDTDAEVELLDPVGTGESYAVASYRNLYSADIYSATVSPVVTEYSFGDDQLFSSYEFLPGNEVKAGDTLLLAGTESVDKLIKAQKETLSDMVENHEEILKDLSAQYAEDKADEQYWAQVVQNSLGQNPGEKAANYSSWVEKHNQYEALYNKAWLAYARSEENIKEENELFTLDYNYQKGNLARLQKTRNQATIKSTVDGVVVALNYYEKGNRIQKGTSTLAIGDLTKKELKCTYINSGVINKAVEYYAIVNGKKYAVEYIEIDSEEYRRLEKVNGTVYTTFKIDDPNNEITVGSYAAIVVVNSIKENVLCVPKETINRDESGDYVFVLNGSSVEHVGIKKGSSDGAYTEVLSGLNEGDKIQTEFVVPEAANTVVLERGNISSSFNANGYLYYPVSEWIQNPIEYGTVYLEEICVAKYQQVEKGTVLAKIRVVPDSISIARKERTIQRLNERINDLKKEDATVNEKQIKAKQEQIESIREIVNDMKRDAATTEIKAPYDCIVTDVRNITEQSLLGTSANLVQISESSSSYIIVEEEQNRLSYGNVATITFDGADGKKKSVTGTVATVNKLSVSSDLKADYSLILISPEDISEMAGSSMGYEGWWNRSRFSVSIPIREMKDVVLVPKKAVKEIGGTTYVRVRTEGGTIDYRSFIAGGSDSNYYWVVEGLTEGTEICLE